MTARYAVMPTILGYSAFTVGLCLILQPAPRDVAAAAVLGGLVGLLRWLVRRSSSLQVVLPVLAAFMVSALSALAAEHDLTGPGLRAMVAALVVFLPGAALTTAVLELAAGQACRARAAWSRASCSWRCLPSGSSPASRRSASCRLMSGRALGVAPWAVCRRGGRPAPGCAPRPRRTRPSCPASGCWSLVPSASSGSPRSPATPAAPASRSSATPSPRSSRSRWGCSAAPCCSAGPGHGSSHRRALRHGR